MPPGAVRARPVDTRAISVNIPALGPSAAPRVALWVNFPRPATSFGDSLSEPPNSVPPDRFVAPRNLYAAVTNPGHQA